MVNLGPLGPPEIIRANAYKDGIISIIRHHNWYHKSALFWREDRDMYQVERYNIRTETRSEWGHFKKDEAEIVFNALVDYYKKFDNG